MTSIEWWLTYRTVRQRRVLVEWGTNPWDVYVRHPPQPGEFYMPRPR